MNAPLLYRLPSAPAAPGLHPTVLARLAAQLASGAAALDESGAFPHANFAALHAAGLIALVVPKAWGGAGAGLAQARRVIAALAHAEPATALILTMTYLQHLALAHEGSRWPLALRERVARDAVREGALVNALRVEPLLGSPSRGGLPDTMARRAGDGWRLSGHKLYCTGIEGLRWLAVWGRTDEDAPRTGVFLVPRDAPGITIVRSWDHLGLRASGSHEAVFDDVPLPLANAVDLRAPADWAPGAGSRAEQQAQALHQAWMAVLLGALYDAVARAARDWLLGFLRTRAPGSLGAPLASLPRTHEALGEVEALLRSNRVQLDDAVAAVDCGEPPSVTDSGLLKHAVTAQSIDVVERALKLCGNHGLTRHNPLQRHLRDVLCGRVHAPQSDAVLAAAGRRALGL